MKPIKSKIKIIYSLVAFIFIFSVLFNFSVALADYSADTLVAMTNASRADAGLGNLTTNSQLATAAYNKANDMFTNGYFAHNSPDGTTPWDFIKGSGYNYIYAGENLAIGYTEPTELFNAWMNSTTHRENILNSHYREIGMAVVAGTFQGSEAIIVVQEFAVPAEVASIEQVTPTPAVSPTPAANQQNQNFRLILDKSGFEPKNIYLDEKVTFKVTVSGEVQTLEANLFSQTINLLDSSIINTSGSEKTYTLTSKIEKVGESQVTISATDQSGNRQSLDLGQISVHQSVLTKGSTNTGNGFWHTLISNRWIVLAMIFAGIILVGGIAWTVYRKVKLNHLMPASSWRL